MEIRQALAQVSEIRAHLARTESFRGYRSATIAFTGLLGVSAAVAQAAWLPRPTQQLTAYLALWVGVAVFNVLVVGLQICTRARRATLTLSREVTVFAVGQFLPALAAGGFVTLVIFARAQESAWMLPGLWAILFSLGVFASCRLLPRAVFAVGAWYLVGGVLALTWGQGADALSPWSMGLIFGGGQFLTAAILYFTLERNFQRTD